MKTIYSFYDFFMSPFEKRGLGKWRTKYIKKVAGNVLEIGAGTGVNLAHYDFKQIDKIIISDMEIDKTLASKVEKHKHKNIIELKEVDVQSLLFEDKYFDYIVVTLVFCSVNNVEKGLREIKRVLKDNGRLIFMEHVLPKKNPMRKIFDFITPTWKKIAKGCHLNREFMPELEKVGFEIEGFDHDMKTVFVSGRAKKV